MAYGCIFYSFSNQFYNIISIFSQAIEVAERAGVKKLAITHHDPGHNDAFLTKIERECQKRFLNCVLARENMEIIL